MGGLEMNSAGGSEYEAPRALDVQQFAVARAAEVQSLYASLKDRTGGGTLATPRHLRRRTNSHNRRKSFFWTRKLKKPQAAPGGGAGEQEKQDGGEETDKVAKPPCRKVRRRVELKGDPSGGGGKTRDGTQRLVTHVWHAKRCKMKKMWGHWLAEGLTGRGKGSRAVIRWSKDSALLHDASYHTPIELEGPAGGILDVLCAVLDPHPPKLDAVSESEQAEFFGARYGNAVLHHAGKFPCKTIGPVSYMWRPMPTVSGALTEEATTADEEKTALGPLHTRHLWVWIHAAGVLEALDSLQTACKSQGGFVSCRSRSGEFGRLDILGGGANEVLRKVLHPFYRLPHPSENREQTSKAMCALGGEIIKDFNKGPHQSSVIACTKLLAFAGQLPDRAVVAMDVYDPRDVPKWARYMARPPTAVEAPPSLSEDTNVAPVDKPCLPLEPLPEDVSPGQDEPEICIGDQDYHIPPGKPTLDIPQEVETFAAGACCGFKEEGNVKELISLWWELLERGAIWNEPSGYGHPMTEQFLSTIRHIQGLSFYSADKSRSAFRDKLPEMDASRTKRHSGCPLLLLKNEHQRSSGCRWSLVMPISWVRAFWVPLVFAGGHVIGQRELRWLASDAGLPSYPFDYPDCDAYTDYVNEKSALLLEHNKKRPSASRVVPFLSPWNFGAVPSQHATSGEKISVSGVPFNARAPDVNTALSTHSCELLGTDGGLSQERTVEVELKGGSDDQTLHFVGAGHVGLVPVGSFGEASNGVLVKREQVYGRLQSSQQVEGANAEISSSNWSGPLPVASAVLDSAYLPAASRESHTSKFSYVARTRLMISQALAAENLCHLPVCSKDTATGGASEGISLIKGSICFVRVHIQAPRKGVIEEGALVYLPSSKDTDAWFSTCDRWQGYYVTAEKPQKKRGQNCKRKSKEMQADGTRERKKRRVEDALSSSQDLGLAPGLSEKVREFGAELREPVGFVTSAGVRGSFPELAEAFCELVKLGQWRAAQVADMRWENTKDIFLLVRNPRSTVYRPAIATIVLEEADCDT